MLIENDGKPTRLTLIEHKRETLKKSQNPIGLALEDKYWSDIEAP